MENIDREAIISILMVLVQKETSKFPMSKQLAVDRYMRSYIRSLTNFELEIADQIFKNSYVLVPDIKFKIVQASEGYDRFMAKRGWG
jgi:hypothetical protein